MSRRSPSRTRFKTHFWSLLPGLGIPAAFTAMYSTTLNFAPLWVWLVILNITLVALMGKDKLAATQSWPRTPEFTLLLLALLGAIPALFLGGWLFNHKTSKEGFRYGLFAVIILQLGAVWYFWPTLRQWL